MGNERRRRRNLREHEDGSVSWVEDDAEDPSREWVITEGADNSRSVIGRQKPHRFRRQWLGTGLVWLAAEFDGEGNHIGYSGYWESGHDTPVFLEDAGLHQTAESAVTWARERSPQVLIRPPGYRGHLWAGTGEPWPGREVWDPESER